MSTEENKAIIRRLIEEFWNEGHAYVMDEVFAANFVNHNPAPGSAPDREALKQTNIAIRAAVANSHSTIDDLIVEGDRVAWRWTFRGIHTGSLMGIPATGKPLTLTGIVIDRLADGKIVERWAETAIMGMMQQLGIIPMPEQAGA
jgi:predicted ester cyclase